MQPPYIIVKGSFKYCIYECGMLKTETLFCGSMYPYIIELFSLYMFFIFNTEAFNLILSN